MAGRETDAFRLGQRQGLGRGVAPLLLVVPQALAFRCTKNNYWRRRRGAGTGVGAAGAGMCTGIRTGAGTGIGAVAGTGICIGTGPCTGTGLLSLLRWPRLWLWHWRWLWLWTRPAPAPKTQREGKRQHC